MVYNYFIKFKIRHWDNDAKVFNTVVGLNYILNAETYPIFLDAFVDSHREFDDDMVYIDNISFLGAEESCQ